MASAGIEEVPAVVGQPGVEGQPRAADGPPAGAGGEGVGQRDPGTGAGPAPPTITIPGTQHPAPSPLTYEQWSAADFALTQIMLWAGLAGGLALSILQHLGFDAGDHARCVASATLAELLEALGSWTFNGRPMNFAIKSKLTTFYHGCRYACGLAEHICPSTPTVYHPELCWASVYSNTAD